MLIIRSINDWLVLFAGSVLLALGATAYAQTVISIPYSPHQSPEYTNYYFEAALKLALAKTVHSHGEATITSNPLASGRERQRAILKKNAGLDVIWSSTNAARESQLLAVKFNLLRELSNKKILLIRTEDKAKFAAVKSLNDLRAFKAGTGTHWQDTRTLQYNNMPLVTAWNYQPMFKMLIAKRFDYMIRGSQEIFAELAQHPNLPIMAEEQLLISYDLPVYFFVNPANVALAERIKKGLEIAEKDGSLATLFFSIPSFKQGYQAVNSKPRVLLKMQSAD
jgi:Bacterial extracellular solute-binding proteins, family 3